MPFIGSAPTKSFVRSDGVRTGAEVWQEAKAAAVKIRADAHDTHDEDIGDALSALWLRDGGNQPTADLPMDSHKFTGVANATARTQFASAGQIADGALIYAGTSAGTDTITASLSPAITAYVVGQRYHFKAGGTNTGAATINLNSVGAKSIKKGPDGATALAAGDITSGGMYDVEYDGTNFQLINPGTQATGPASSTDNAIVRFDGTGGKTLQNSTATIDDDGNLTLTVSEDGAAANPTLTLARASATPAANDVIGQVNFQGNDSGAGVATYAAIDARILDPTNGSEDGELRLRARIADSNTVIAAFATGATIGSPTGSYQGAGTLNATGLFVNAVSVSVSVAGTAQATTSGTSFDFTGLPAAVKRIIVMFDGVSLSSTGDFLIQIGDSGGIEATGYTSTSAAFNSSATSAVAPTTGFGIVGALDTRTLTGHMTITRLTGNIWVASHSGLLNTSTGVSGAGRKELSGELDRVRLTNTNTGANSFDAGSVNILYEV
jgi:hypothetical protein